MKLLAVVAIAVIALIGSAEAAQDRQSKAKMRAWCDGLPEAAVELHDYFMTKVTDETYLAQRSKNAKRLSEALRKEQTVLAEGTWLAVSYLAFCKPPPQ